MDSRYNSLKFLVGVFNIGYLLFCGISIYSIRQGVWWKFVCAAVLIFFILLKWVSFIKKNENLWAFVITLIIGLPFNIKISRLITGLYFDYTNLFFTLIYGIIFFMSCLAMEEILVGMVIRILWRKQNDTFFENNE